MSLRSMRSLERHALQLNALTIGRQGICPFYSPAWTHVPTPDILNFPDEHLAHEVP